MGQDLPLEAREDLPGSSGAWSQEMSEHDTEELLPEVTDDQIVEIVAEGAEFVDGNCHPSKFDGRRVLAG
jgi:hypothetical protein